MTDIYDQATEREEKERELCLALARSNNQKLLPKGECFNCSEALAPPCLFCDVDCRDDWQRRNPNK